MTESLPLLSLGTSSFAALRMRGQLYVDKTELVYALASQPGKFFLTRPRRFGKSLLVSTFESLFRHGLRDFQGLAIEKLWKDAGEYRVARLDFSEIREFASEEEFEKDFCALLASEFGRLGFCFDPDNTILDIHIQLSDWLKTLPLGSLVVLVDEYDAPLTACMENAALFQAVRSELSTFYAVVKANDQAIRFLFVTGITRFGTGLNTLSDITLDEKYGTLLGFTRDEVERCFGGFLDRAAEVLKTGRKELMRSLTAHYGGWCFDEKAASRVFAPWPLLRFFGYPENGFQNYWFASGGSARGVARYFRNPEHASPLCFGSGKRLSLESLEHVSIDHLNDLALLTQAGYFTIGRVEGRTASLEYPNQDVAQSMARLYSAMLLEGKTLEQAGGGGLAAKMETEPAEAIVRFFSRLFESVDFQTYPVTNDTAFRAVVQAWLTGAGLAPKAAAHGSGLEVRAGSRLWVFEFRVGQREDAGTLLRGALEQLQGRRIEAGELVRAALVFSTEKRQIAAWGCAG